MNSTVTLNQEGTEGTKTQNTLFVCSDIGTALHWL